MRYLLKMALALVFASFTLSAAAWAAEVEPGVVAKQKSALEDQKNKAIGLFQKDEIVKGKMQVMARYGYDLLSYDAVTLQFVADEKGAGSVQLVSAFYSKGNEKGQAFGYVRALVSTGGFKEKGVRYLESEKLDAAIGMALGKTN